jgi:hypothetical protein
VDGHRRARAALRDSHPIRIPSTLLGLLSQIPHCPPDDDAGTQQSDPWRPPSARGHGGPPPEGGTSTRSSGGVGPSELPGRFTDGSTRDRPEPR